MSSNNNESTTENNNQTNDTTDAMSDYYDLCDHQEIRCDAEQRESPYGQ